MYGGRVVLGSISWNVLGLGPNGLEVQDLGVRGSDPRLCKGSKAGRVG